MYVFYDPTNGKIIGVCDAASPVVTPPSNPGVPIYLDDIQYADVRGNQGEYIIQNGAPVYTPIPDSEKLANAQQEQISLIRQGYAQTINQGFQCEIGTTIYTFGWQLSDQLHLVQVQKAIDQGIDTFPIEYADINGNVVSIPDQATLTTLDAKAKSFQWAQTKQLRSLIGQVQQATTVSGVQAITWTPAAY